MYCREIQILAGNAVRIFSVSFSFLPKRIHLYIGINSLISFFACFQNFACLFFFQNHFFEIFFQEYHQCQTVWIQIRSNVMSSLIWVQTVCKGYQQPKLIGRVNNFLNNKFICNSVRSDIYTLYVYL